MEDSSQLTGGSGHKGVIVKEKVRTLQSQIIHPPETLDSLSDVAGKGGKQQLSKPVMGIACRHGDHLGVRIANLYSTPKTDK